MNSKNFKSTVELSNQSMGSSEHSSSSISLQPSTFIFKDSEREVFDLCSLEDATSLCSGLYLGTRFDEIPTIAASKTPEDCVKSSIVSADSTEYSISTHATMVSLALEVLVPSAPIVPLPVCLPIKSINVQTTKTALTQPPIPPPFRTNKPTYVELRPPVAAAQIAVRRLSLGCGPQGPTQEDHVLELCLSLIDRACALRHIPQRKRNSNPQHESDWRLSESPIDTEYLEKVDVWMNASSDVRHDRTTGVLRVCLEGCGICVARASTESVDRRDRLSQRLTVGSFLPLIEESLAV